MNAYKQAIDLLMSSKIDFQALGIELAKSHPALFVALATSKNSAPQWHRDAIEHLRNEERVMAVKTIRDGSNLGLKEAVDVCNELQNILYHRGIVSRAHQPYVNHAYPPSPIGKDALDLAQTISRAV